MRTTEDPTDPLGKLVSAQETIGLDHFSLAMNPLGLDGVQPRTLLGQQTAYDPHSFSCVLDFSIVSSEPAPDLFGDMPTCVVPDEHQYLLADLFELFATPREETGRYRAHGATIDEPQPRLIKLGQVEPVSGDGFRIGIILGDRLLDEAQRLAFLGPATQGRQSQSTPPALVTEAYHPGVGVSLGHANQSVAAPFFFRIGDRGR
jgi:hypothetical protein